MHEWSKTTLKDHVEILHGYAFKSSNFREKKIKGSLPVIKIKNVANGDVNLHAVSYHIVNSNLEKYIVRCGDVLIALTGNHPQAASQVVGSISKYKINQPALLNQRIAKIISKATLDSNFMYYYLKQQFVKEYIANQSSGSANQANINKNDLNNIPLYLPPLPEQKAIAEVLSSLDDKIDLLHRQNKTLESLAETLFRQWFIEEAKDEWVETKLGFYLIPKKGENLTKSQAMGGDIPVVAGGLKPSCFHNRANTDKPVITISASGANAGFIKLYYESVWSSDSSYIDSSVTKNIYFIYNFLKVNQIALFKKQTGSAQPHIYPQQIMDLDIRKYPQTLIDSFEHKVIGFFAKISNNNLKLNKLTHLRDILLPNLMSGKVRISI